MSFFGTVKTTSNFPSHKIHFMRKTEALLTGFLEHIFSVVNQNLLGNRIASSLFGDFFPIVHTSSYQTMKKFPTFVKAIGILNEYYTACDNDGWKQMNNPIPLPSGSIIIDQVQDLEGKDNWLPIQYENGIVQKPLHPSAHLVRHVISDTDAHKILDEYQSYFDAITDDERDKEYRAVYEKSLMLTDKEKIIAEFWAGGPMTLKPPGFWNFFLYVMCTNKQIPYEEIVRNFFLLNASLFETGLCVWTKKYEIVQERPIQHIRRTINESISNFYFNDITTSKLWLPYQERDFVTPPFPDFVSGHSSFSGAGSQIMIHLFGDDLLSQPLKIEGEHMVLLSPIFETKCDEVVDLTCINVYPKSSNIVPGVTPTQMINLEYTSWTQMALEAGLSRLYGGIHIASSNYPGTQVGKLVANSVLKQFA
jgi:hypothetical protein